MPSRMYKNNKFAIVNKNDQSLLVDFNDNRL